MIDPKLADILEAAGVIDAAQAERLREEIRKANEGEWGHLGKPWLDPDAHFLP